MVSWVRVQGAGFRVQRSAFRVQGSGFRVQVVELGVGRWALGVGHWALDNGLGVGGWWLGALSLSVLSLPPYLAELLDAFHNGPVLLEAGGNAYNEKRET